MQDFIERQIEKFEELVARDALFETAEGRSVDCLDLKEVKSFLLSFQREMVEFLEQELPKKEDIKLVHQVFGKMEDLSAAYDYAGGQTNGYNRCLSEIRLLLSKMKQ